MDECVCVNVCERRASQRVTKIFFWKRTSRNQNLNLNQSLNRNLNLNRLTLNHSLKEIHTT